MRIKFYHDKLLSNKQNIFYYDEIAGEYNDILDQDLSNQLVRDKVSAKFLVVVNPGWVLDLGGGTGRDLSWMAGKYNIIFCEPSQKMREMAKQYATGVSHQGNIVFLDDEKSDFTHWHKHLPFLKPVDAILSNFAVINCIPDIKLLFNNLALALKKGGHMIALILHTSSRDVLRSKRGIMSFLTGTPLTMNVQYKNNQHTVYHYTIRQIKKASAAHFDFYESESIHESGFILIHLIRK